MAIFDRLTVLDQNAVTVPARGARISLKVFIASTSRTLSPVYLTADLDKAGPPRGEDAIDGADHRRLHRARMIGDLLRRVGGLRRRKHDRSRGGCDLHRDRRRRGGRRVRRARDPNPQIAQLLSEADVTEIEVEKGRSAGSGRARDERAGRRAVAGLGAGRALPDFGRALASASRRPGAAERRSSGRG